MKLWSTLHQLHRKHERLWWTILAVIAIIVLLLAAGQVRGW